MTKGLDSKAKMVKQDLQKSPGYFREFEHLSLWTVTPCQLARRATALAAEKDTVPIVSGDPSRTRGRSIARISLSKNVSFVDYRDN